MRCPHCGRVLFWSRLPWLPCSAEAALISVRCTRKQSCGVYVPLRVPALTAVRFENEAARQATAAALLDALMGVVR